MNTRGSQQETTNGIRPSALSGEVLNMLDPIWSVQGCAELWGKVLLAKVQCTCQKPKFCVGFGLLACVNL